MGMVVGLKLNWNVQIVDVPECHAKKSGLFEGST